MTPFINSFGFLIRFFCVVEIVSVHCSDHGLSAVIDTAKVSKTNFGGQLRTRGGYNRNEIINLPRIRNEDLVSRSSVVEKLRDHHQAVNTGHQSFYRKRRVSIQSKIDGFSLTTHTGHSHNKNSRNSSMFGPPPMVLGSSMIFSPKLRRVSSTTDFPSNGANESLAEDASNVLSKLSTVYPTSPLNLPSSLPTPYPSKLPISFPFKFPASFPSKFPTSYPTKLPTSHPSKSPASSPSKFPISLPSKFPTSYPSKFPTSSPSKFPTSYPSKFPTSFPSKSPTSLPSKFPTSYPSKLPTSRPSILPTSYPSKFPTSFPSKLPTYFPSKLRSSVPTKSLSALPTLMHSGIPSVPPSFPPSNRPSSAPTLHPSVVPSRTPSKVPSFQPSIQPSQIPSFVPTARPSTIPSLALSNLPSTIPSISPTFVPSLTPSHRPTVFPTFECHDIRSYSDKLGLDCSAHNQTNCLNFGTVGYSKEDVEDLIINCPQSCRVACDYEATVVSCPDVPKEPWENIRSELKVNISPATEKLDSVKKRKFDNLSLNYFSDYLTEKFNSCPNVVIFEIRILGQRLVREKRDEKVLEIRLVVEARSVGFTGDELSELLNAAIQDVGYKTDLMSLYISDTPAKSIGGSQISDNNQNSGRFSFFLPFILSIVTLVFVILGYLSRRRDVSPVRSAQSVSSFLRNRRQYLNVGRSSPSAEAPQIDFSLIHVPPDDIIRSSDSGSSSEMENSNFGGYHHSPRSYSFRRENRIIPPMIVVSNIDGKLEKVEESSSGESSIAENDFFNNIEDKTCSQNLHYSGLKDVNTQHLTKSSKISNTTSNAVHIVSFNIGCSNEDKTGSKFAGFHDESAKVEVNRIQSDFMQPRRKKRMRSHNAMVFKEPLEFSEQNKYPSHVHANQIDGWNLTQSQHRILDKNLPQVKKVPSEGSWPFNEPEYGHARSYAISPISIGSSKKSVSAINSESTICNSNAQGRFHKIHSIARSCSVSVDGSKTGSVSSKSANSNSPDNNSIRQKNGLSLASSASNLAEKLKDKNSTKNIKNKFLKDNESITCDPNALKKNLSCARSHENLGFFAANTMYNNEDDVKMLSIKKNNVKNDLPNFKVASTKTSILSQDAKQLDSKTSDIQPSSSLQEKSLLSKKIESNLRQSNLRGRICKPSSSSDVYTRTASFNSTDTGKGSIDTKEKEKYLSDAATCSSSCDKSTLGGKNFENDSTKSLSSTIIARQSSRVEKGKRIVHNLNEKPIVKNHKSIFPMNTCSTIGSTSSSVEEGRHTPLHRKVKSFIENRVGIDHNPNNAASLTNRGEKSISFISSDFVLKSMPGVDPEPPLKKPDIKNNNRPSQPKTGHKDDTQDIVTNQPNPLGKARIVSREFDVELKGYRCTLVAPLNVQWKIVIKTSNGECPVVDSVIEDSLFKGIIYPGDLFLEVDKKVVKHLTSSEISDRLGVIRKDKLRKETEIVLFSIEKLSDDVIDNSPVHLLQSPYQATRK